MPLCTGFHETFQVVSRISSINSTDFHPSKCCDPCEPRTECDNVGSRRSVASVANCCVWVGGARASLLFLGQMQEIDSNIAMIYPPFMIWSCFFFFGGGG